MEAVLENTVRWERDWTWEGLPVLHGECVLPAFAGDTAAGRRMERFWRHWERLLVQWLEQCHKRCCQQAEQALAASRPIVCRQVRVESRTLYRDGEWLSLMIAVKTPGGSRYFPELWRLGDGTPAACRALLPLWGRVRYMGKPLALTQEGVCVVEPDGRLCPVKCGRKNGKNGKRLEPESCGLAEKQV